MDGMVDDGWMGWWMECWMEGMMNGRMMCHQVIFNPSDHIDIIIYPR